LSYRDLQAFWPARRSVHLFFQPKNNVKTFGGQEFNA
jgi:hypothetical protein